jgi:hypothetical protein
VEPGPEGGNRHIEVVVVVVVLRRNRLVEVVEVVAALAVPAHRGNRYTEVEAVQAQTPLLAVATEDHQTRIIEVHNR